MIEVSYLRNIYGNLPNSQLLIIIYIDKLISLTSKLQKYQTNYKQSNDILAQNSKS